MAKQTVIARIADILVRNKALDQETLTAAQEEAKGRSQQLERYLMEKKLVAPDEMTRALSEYLKMPPISLAHFTPNPTLVEIVPKELMHKHLAIPICKTGRNLTVALGDPFDLIAMDELASLTSCSITPLVASESDITATLERCFAVQAEGMNMEQILEEVDESDELSTEKVQDEGGESIEAMLQGAEGAPVVRMVNMMLLEALRTGASDIHLEPQEKNLMLRYRIDGSLMESPNPPKSMQGAILSRFKLMSGMDIAERRIPQDGRIKIRALGKEVDLRVNTLPTIHGEKIVLRILDKSGLFANLDVIGLDEFALRAMKHAIAAPNGIVLVTGPTGSGKTTTLYSCLLELNKPDVNIVTCEDPVEYQLEGINQVMINAFVGLTFATALRSVLRQSPDIILVGEIRDSETADIAVKAALTGHLVLSTLHTNDAAGAITRMVDMGIEPSLLASALILAQAQRLMRRLCSSCKKAGAVIPDKVYELYDIKRDYFDGGNIHGPGGCPKCRGGGYKGRIAIMEVMPMSRQLRQDIMDGLSAKEINVKVRAAGMMSLKDVALQKVKAGLASIDSALEVTGGD